MGISFGSETRIAGYRLSLYKNGIGAYSRTQSASRFIDIMSNFPLRPDGAIIYEECLDRGLIDGEMEKITEEGRIIARSKTVARTPAAKGWKLLDAFLDRVDALNADPEAISRVDEIWLFGSLMRGEDSIGDIDLAIGRTSRKPGDFDGDLEGTKALVAAFPDAPQSWTWPWDRIDWLYRRAVFGPRRHRLLAGVQDGMTDLALLGVPCRLVYDRARGGWVEDPILPRHPTSKGRSNEMDPLPEIPDLAPVPIRPMDGHWIAAYDHWGIVSPYEIFRGWTQECRRLFPHYPEQLRVVTHRGELSNFPWVPKTLKSKGLDGRDAIAIICATEYWGTCVTLRRAID